MAKIDNQSLFDEIVSGYLDSIHHDDQGNMGTYLKKIQENWADCSEKLLNEFKIIIDSSYGRFRISFSSFLLNLKPALNDVDWLTLCVNELIERSHSSDLYSSYRENELKGWKSIFNEFKCWNDQNARNFLNEENIIDHFFNFKITRQMLSPSSQISLSTRICVSLVFLMSENDELIKKGYRPNERELKNFKSELEEITNLSNECVRSIFDRLKELPTRHYNQKSLWSNFGPHEKAAWRADIAKYIGDQKNVAHGLIEFLLWQVTEDQFGRNTYSEMEIIIISLCKKDEDIQFLKDLHTHPSRLVQIRSMSILAHLGQTTQLDPFNPPPEDGVTAVAAYQALSAVAGGEYYPPRTWTGHANFDRTIYSRISNVEKTFCDQYKEIHKSDEEVILANLLSKVESNLQGVNDVFNTLTHQGLGVQPKIDFSYRQIPKHEEGRSGIAGAHRFSVDVAFIIKITDAGRLVTHRASFIQCKKLNSDDNGVWRKSFDIDQNQCDDLISQTESSFYMFFSPVFVEREIWMTPAKLIRNLSKLYKTKGTLPMPTIHFASRSFAHWLTYDLFGLWTGDETTDAIQKAEGQMPGYSPRFVVSIVINRNPTQKE